MTALHIAAFLFFLLGLGHSILGERYILIRLFRRPDLPKLFGGTFFTIQTLRFAWHITTVAFWGLAGIIVAVSHGMNRAEDLVRIVAWTAVISALLPLWFTRGRHLSWLVFLAIAGLLFYWSSH
jgi:hypothetical protein